MSTPHNAHSFPPKVQHSEAVRATEGGGQGLVSVKGTIQDEMRIVYEYIR